MSNFSFLSEALKKAGVQRLGNLGTNHPSAFFAFGVAGMIGSTVLACRATLKLSETLEEYDKPLDWPLADGESARNKVQAGLAIARLYAPAVIIGVASVTMLTKSHSVLTKRNAALSAAYTALDNGFRDYRARVVEKYGKDEDDKLRYGFEVEKTKEGTKTVKVERVNPETGASIYARFFDEYNPNWDKDPEINKLFLRAQQNYLNDLLHARGHLFLNEVYAALGFDHSEAGAVVGWIFGDGDNYVDLGIFSAKDPDRIREFVNGREASVLLDFNVDGVIYDKLGNKPRVGTNYKRNLWYRV